MSHPSDSWGVNGDAGEYPTDVIVERGSTWLPIPDDGGFSDLIGPTYRSVVPDPRQLRLGFRVEAKHCNKMGFCHGGMLATFLDISLGTIANAIVGGVVGKPTIHLSVDYLRPALEGVWVEGQAQVRHTTRRMIFVDGALHDSSGLLAKASAIFKMVRE